MKKNFLLGVCITLIIALVAKGLAVLPFLSIIGQLVIAIIIGMLWRAWLGVPEKFEAGITFSSKKLLRVGIILLGMRLNLIDIYEAGWSMFAIAVVNLLFALLLVYYVARWLGVSHKLAMLTASGTAICGAAAIVAISPQVKADEEETAVSVGIIAIVGTIFTLGYTLIYQWLPLTAMQYGVFSGSTLHEIAHVIAAASTGGEAAVDTAIVVKLTRVALLVPVALMIGYIFQRKQSTKQAVGGTIIPWFIFGFLAIGAVHTWLALPEWFVTLCVDVAYLLLAMAMAGLGLNVSIHSFKKMGVKAFVTCIIGSIALAVLGYVLTSILI